MHTIPRWLFAALISPLFAACAATPPAVAGPPSAPSSTTAGAVGSADESGKSQVCDLVCEQARVAKRADDDPDYHAKATEDANRVLERVRPELLACYKARVAVQPNAHGFITVDVIVGPDGHVLKVETTGGAILGPQTLSCITERLKGSTFAPPHGGGTLRIHVPFSLRRVAAGEDA